MQNLEENNESFQFELLACLSLNDGSVGFDHFTSAPPLDIRHLYRYEALERARKTRDRCGVLGARILYPGHPWYPESFFDLEEPPLFLTCLGSPAWRDHLSISVVGSREPSRQSLAWLDEHLGAVAHTRAFSIVSGGARGIDQRAHAVSLRHGAPTVAFLPSGLARVFPEEFSSWIPEILASGGAVLSEFAPDEPMARENFERRNRMIAAMGVVTLVAEARRRSGSMITARHARDIGRSVCVLPCFPGDSRTAGGLDLLFDGAQPLRDAADLVGLLGLIPGAAQAPDRSH